LAGRNRNRELVIFLLEWQALRLQAQAQVVKHKHTKPRAGVVRFPCGGVAMALRADGNSRLNGLLEQPIFFEPCFWLRVVGVMADLLTLTEQALAGVGVDLVDVERAPLGLLRVTIDRPDGVRIEDCELVSKQLSRVYEVENVDYRRLEVTSPGTDRVLRTQADFQRFAGQRVEVKLRQAQDGQKVFAGCLHVCESVKVPGTDSAFEFELELEDDAKTVRKRSKATSAESAQIQTLVRVLRFAYSDVERARLAPVLDFKGKKR